MRNVLIYFAYKYFGDWDKIYNALNIKEEVNWEKFNNKKDKNDLITILDDEYPDELKGITKPPFVLFIKGNKDLLYDNKSIWIYGSYINEKFSKITEEIQEEINKENLTTILGYSDSYENHLINNFKLKNSIIVKDSGIDSQLIFTNKEQNKVLNNNGVIISEYPGYVIPTFKTWESSNRIKIGLSKGLLLINSLKDKNTFKLIRETLEEGKEVYGLNKKVDTKSHNNVLISKGAYSITKIKELN